MKPHVLKRVVKIITLAAALVAECELPRAEPEIHLIPKGYVGSVTIAFRATNGETPAYEGDPRLYRIPSTAEQFRAANPEQRKQALFAIVVHESTVSDSQE